MLFIYFLGFFKIKNNNNNNNKLLHFNSSELIVQSLLISYLGDVKQKQTRTYKLHNQVLLVRPYLMFSVFLHACDIPRIIPRWKATVHKTKAHHEFYSICRLFHVMTLIFQLNCVEKKNWNLFATNENKTNQHGKKWDIWK